MSSGPGLSRPLGSGLIDEPRIVVCPSPPTGLAVTDPTRLPADLPAPEDDGAAAHLPGARVPHVALPATAGGTIDLAALRGRVVVFAYPATGRPGEPPPTADWDLIPGARGCTPQVCGFRDLAAELGALGVGVVGLSAQEPAEQREMVGRLHVPFPILSDAGLRLAAELGLPTFEAAGRSFLRRLTWVQRDGVIETVLYPVFPPDRGADQVLARLRSADAPPA